MWLELPDSQYDRPMNHLRPLLARVGIAGAIVDPFKNISTGR
jgi:hypothetical protein